MIIIESHRGAETIKLTLTDPVNGADNIKITDNSSFHGTTVYNFLASRAEDRAINKLFLILVGDSGNHLVETGVLRRQQAQ